MGLEIKQALKMTQQLVMTPQLQQAIKLLQLSRLELADTINQELLENPMLEMVEETDQQQRQEDADSGGEPADATGPDGPLTQDLGVQAEGSGEVDVREQVSDEFDWENYLGEYSSATRAEESAIHEDKDAPPYESLITRSASLQEHLLWQLKMSRLDDEQMRVGELIIGNLDGDGYLQSSLEDIAQQRGVSPAQAEVVLKVIQQLDPLGVAARDLRECLLIQALELYPQHDVALDILEGHMDLLEKRQYQQIAKKLGVGLDEVAEALDIIRLLDPKPGRSVSEEEPQYITPDIYVYKIDGEFVIVLNEDGLPKLRVNNFYRDSLAKGGDPKAKEYVQDKLRSAMWLIRSIHQRQRTIYKVTEAIVKFQREFFERGVAQLKPLVLRDVAEEVGMHESTISRVTTNKYVHTPQGVFELKYFFNSGINRVDGGSLASEAVKDRIRHLIAEEDRSRPLSDQTIAEMLKKEDIDIARRTVAKYREMLGILPSSRRREPLGGLPKANGR
ncbi:RNA polymerase, sigma 54 subunit, RpoN [Desulfarculus baarsii DSM 2075]|uniref:RNA polymerase, sigma 54 subunit, RpoN n=1 Tax=Desulfarculus baarsii (strain ATCC 33931 / DSM 2075 / LMG 7858 / VKM B-1802 / 2st14) TaxID=644282 RepID=E1QL61_DESB2|nr:RNA polymerase factor sigma-54 [Desulfarculus baarsii]ADK85326.1 RNA polymerase, sigma 54 subunit, RpoN [Desulfarculus baarsii DSM 2075]